MTAPASPIPQTLRGVIFDLDGTLANTLPICYAAFRATFARYIPDRKFNDADIASYFGPDEEGVIQRVIPEREHWAAALELFLKEYDAAHASCAEPFPGVVAILNQLHEGSIPIAVVTGKGAQSAALSLQRLGLAEQFTLVEAGSPEGIVKPRAIRKVLDAWGVTPEEVGNVAYVGDAPSDVTAAREARVVPIAAAWAPTADPDALSARQPAELFRSIAEFGNWLGERGIVVPKASGGED